MRISGTLILVLSCLLICSGGVATAQGTSEDPITVNLGDEVIEIPNGRPIYALLVSGFHQNRNLDMFHFYNFAKCLLKRGAYVHYSWWNNLLAPYMERPLHDPYSVPSTGPLPAANIANVLPFAPSLIKARPRDDHQFQADAKALLAAIREENPDAAIILVGHSMGGDSVARLADSVDGEIDIALLAPIDPVGNRTCVRTFSWSLWEESCNGVANFSRWRATHLEWLADPPRRSFTDRVKYLYHRWQQEFSPPFDVACPPGPNPRDWDCLSGKQYSEYLFSYPEYDPGEPVTSIGGNSTNVQSIIWTDLNSHEEAPRYSGDGLTGELDGHGEIVGFRGVVPWTSDSYPLGLSASSWWPSRSAAIELMIWPTQFTPIYVPLPPWIGAPWPDQKATDARVELLKEWEANPDLLDQTGHAPEHPEYCMVSGDLCEILRTTVNAAPVADAGSYATEECTGPNGASLTLDGSGSSDPNGDPLAFTWVGPFGTRTGETIDVDLPLGTHEITLTVDDGRGETDTDTVLVTVIDSTLPSLSVSVSPDVLWPPRLWSRWHKLVSIAASIQVSDSCDGSSNVELVSIVSNGDDDGSSDRWASRIRRVDTSDIQGASFGTDDREFLLRAERVGRGLERIYRISYRSIDASGNVADATAEVTVPKARFRR